MAAASPIISLVAAGLLVAGVLAAYLGIVEPMQGFTAYALGGLAGGLFATVVALIGLFVTRGGSDPAGRQSALIGLMIALALPILVLGPAAIVGGDAPPINDITTDLADPPAFADAALVPDYRNRDMTYPTDFVPIVEESYPDLAPLRVDDAPMAAFARAEIAAEGLGWEIVARDGDALAFYARDVSGLFRFVDDVVVRVRPDGAGAKIDVRSKSRDGRGDMGANAARIRALLSALES
ncbi:MAG: DUF1499 domain-containing protein [Myxococcota bacterium]